MSWHDATVADLVRGRRATTVAGERPERRSTRATVPRAPFGERVLGGTRTVATLAAVSGLVLVLAAGVVTLVPGLAAGSRFVADDRAGRPVRLLRDALTTVRTTTRVAWPIGVVTGLVVGAVVANLAFLLQQPTAVAGAFLALNLAVVAIGGWWLAACARELADDPTLSRRALVHAATARALRPSRWHLALALAVLGGAALALVSPFAAAVFAPGLALLAGRLADPAQHS